MSDRAINTETVKILLKKLATKNAFIILLLLGMVAFLVLWIFVPFPKMANAVGPGNKNYSGITCTTGYKSIVGEPQCTVCAEGYVKAPTDPKQDIKEAPCVKKSNQTLFATNNNEDEYEDEQYQ